MSTTTKAERRAELLSGVRVPSTGETFDAWCRRTVDEAPPASDQQVAELLALFRQAASGQRDGTGS